MAALVGAVAGMTADLDVLIRSSADPLLNLEYHRHFSHSLLFVPLGALLKRSPRAAQVGLVFAALYLGLAGLQSHRAESALRELAAARAQLPEALLVKPTLGNLLL